VRLVLSLATAVALYFVFLVTVGGTWSHNEALDACAAKAPRKMETGAQDRWRWWPPGHAHRCVYEPAK
jgi:hypothetical protein